MRLLLAAPWTSQLVDALTTANNEYWLNAVTPTNTDCASKFQVSFPWHAPARSPAPCEPLHLTSTELVSLWVQAWLKQAYYNSDGQPEHDFGIAVFDAGMSPLLPADRWMYLVHSIGGFEPIPTPP